MISYVCNRTAKSDSFLIVQISNIVVVLNGGEYKFILVAKTVITYMIVQAYIASAPAMT